MGWRAVSIGYGGAQVLVEHQPEFTAEATMPNDTAKTSG